MALKDWKRVSAKSNYLVWDRIDERVGNYNKFSLVVKTELGEWVVFLSAGTFEGSKTLLRPKSKSQALAFAKEYMRLN